MLAVRPFPHTPHRLQHRIESLPNLFHTHLSNLVLIKSKLPPSVKKTKLKMSPRTAFLIGSFLLASSSAFELGQIFNRLPKISIPSPNDGNPSPAIINTKNQLLNSISDTANGKEASLDTQRIVLGLVKSLETASPASPEILTNPDEAKLLDGVWYLQYTAPSDIDDDEVEAWKPKDGSEGELKMNNNAANLQGSVRASGITVDTANRVTMQTIDTANNQIFNDVEQDFGMISVGGSFRVSETVPTRAIVAFNKADIKLNNGPDIRLGFVFDIIAIFRGGIRDNGWLETTYVDSDIRIGRGNKGSLFVLTREKSLPTL